MALENSTNHLTIFSTVEYLTKIYTQVPKVGLNEFSYLESLSPPTKVAGYEGAELFLLYLVDFLKAKCGNLSLLSEGSICNFISAALKILWLERATPEKYIEKILETFFTEKVGSFPL